MRFRIQKLYAGFYRVQQKGWLFWHTLGHQEASLMGFIWVPSYYSTFDEARAQIRGVLSDEPEDKLTWKTIEEVVS